jgi:hypothetical protein
MRAHPLVEFTSAGGEARRPTFVGYSPDAARGSAPTLPRSGGKSPRITETARFIVSVKDFRPSAMKLRLPRGAGKATTYPVKFEKIDLAEIEGRKA